MADLEWIFKRRSIRKFTNEKISDEQIQSLLEAGMAGPSAVNFKPWKFIVIDDESVLDALRRALPVGKINAPLAIVVCGDLRTIRKPVGEKFWIQDCSAASENILLAATTMGLGSVWCGVHPIGLIEKPVRKALDIPDGVIPLNVIYLGYPDEEKPARTQYSPKNVYRNRFGENWE